MTNAYDIAIIHGQVYLDGAFVTTNVYINGDTIAHISEEKYHANVVYDCKKQLVIPGLIDPHVHFELNAGNRTSVDDFYTGSVCAAYGGITTVIDFIDPARNATELEALYHKRRKLAENSRIDCLLHATIANPNGSLEAFVMKMKALNLQTLKLFTTYSNSLRKTDDDSIVALLKLSEKHKFLIMAHIEDDDMIDLNPNFGYIQLPLSRPTISETKEACKIASMVREFGGYVYMVHLSSGKTLQILKDRYQDILGKRFFIESCPHYFVFSSQDLHREDGYLYTMAPPLRSPSEVVILKEFIDSVDTIATDHCSFMKKDKAHSLLKDIPLGIGGVEHSFDVMYHLYQDAIIGKMSSRVAELFGLHHKGNIAVGKDADLFIYQLSKSSIQVSHSASDAFVYQGMPTSGKVISTMAKGKWVILQQALVKEVK